MKIYFKELPADYKSYTFPYQVFAQADNNEEIEQLYSQGFVKSRLGANTLYLCRSCRIDLNRFELTSENRRILRKVENIKLTVHELANFEYHFSIGKLAKDFYDARSGSGTMSAQKMKWIFTEGGFTHVMEFKDTASNEVVGYCPIYVGKESFHYAYPFYMLDYPEKSLGLGMMTLALIWAKEQGLNHGYLGTVYTSSSLYKTNFNGFEFFDGESWSDSIEKLKKFLQTL